MNQPYCEERACSRERSVVGRGNPVSCNPTSNWIAAQSLFPITP
jgi:hypothetical protein